MRQIILLIAASLLFSVGADAQTKKINDLKKEHAKINRKITESEKILTSTKRNVKAQLSNLALINGKIDERSRYIQTIRADIDEIVQNISTMQGKIDQQERLLNDKKLKYEVLMKHVHRQRSIQDRLLFIFSAKSMTQIYRRIRYVREYSKYLRVQANYIEQKRNELSSRRSELEATKNMKDGMVAQEEAEKQKLEKQQKERQVLVNNLKTQEKNIQKTIADNRRKAASLNAQIDRLVAAEVAAAKKRAEEKRKAEEKAARLARERENKRRLAEAKAAEERARARERAAATKSANEKAAAARELASAVAATKAAEVKISEDAKVAKMEAYRMDKSDAVLTGNIERNKGRLPMPITGAYVIVGRYGQYSVEGLKNVRLDNKGIDIKGRPGAKARAIFSGEVSAVFQLGGMSNVLIRHGRYISVYCNLSSVSVRRGQSVNTRDVIGTVATDGDNNCILHFQLRRETAKLNPEQWLSR